MSWFFLTLLSVFIVSIANILQRVLMKGDKSDPFSYAIVFHFLLGIVNLLFAVLNGFHLPPLDGSLVLFIVAAALWGIGTVFVFKALQLLESSEVTILTSVRALVTITASILFLHETFNWQKALGTLIILASVFFVTNLKRGMTFNKGVLYSMAMAFFYGLAVVVDVFNLKNYDPISYLAVANFFIGTILLLFYPKIFRQWKGFVKPTFLKKMLPLGIFSSIQAIAYYYALTKGPSSQIAPINQAQVIVTVLLAAILLKERDHLFRKLIAAALVTVGVILLK